ncbi:hypothetical protein HDU67_002724 [Dinochytrium kinnereticum]|nr:hypothetical protein HDU67_002724 [Dinochytrium kinnereticum]
MAPQNCCSLLLRHVPALLAAALGAIIILQIYILNSTTSTQPAPPRVLPALPAQSKKATHSGLRVAFFTTGLETKWHFMASYQANSTNNFFCVDRPWVHTDYFIFTDGNRETLSRWITDEDLLSRIHLIPKVSKGWPYNTEERYNWMLETITQFPVHYDYIFWQDADLMYARPFCEEIMGDLVGLIHAWFYTGWGPYEARDNSTAQVVWNSERGMLYPYFHAQIFGGTPEEFVPLVQTCADWTKIDHAKGIQAHVDDESYLNAYYHNVKSPSVILDRSFDFVYQKDVLDWMNRTEKMAYSVNKHSFFEQNVDKMSAGL